MSYKKAPSIKSQFSKGPIQKERFQLVMSSSAYEELMNKVKDPTYDDILTHNIPHRVELLPFSATDVCEQMQRFAAMVNEDTNFLNTLTSR